MLRTRPEIPVFVPNTKTRKVELWICLGEFTSRRSGERLCYLRRGKQYVSLPKWIVFDTMSDAIDYLEKSRVKK